MTYQALYRVWRPQTFDDVVGQAHIIQTLKNALSNQTYTHAYLFTGPRGTGKTSTAKIMAKAVNCEQAPTDNPCNQCAACRGITQGTVVDVVEIDAASNNGVDEIRDLRDKVKYAPTEVRLKVYIIDEVHMLSQGAFNALLKTLEEPPAHVMFILATTEPHKIPLTIMSRCQRFDFKRISQKEMLERLHIICAEEGFQVEQEALELLTQVAEGGMRDCLSLLDQAVSFADGEVTVADVETITGSVAQEALMDLADCLMRQETEEAIKRLGLLLDEGKEPTRIVEDLIYFYRDVLLYRQAPGLAEGFQRLRLTERLKEQIQAYRDEHLFQAIERLSRAQQDMKWTHHPRIFLEVALIQLTHHLDESLPEPAAGAHSPRASEEIEQLKMRVDTLEKALKRLGQQGGVTAVGRQEESVSRAGSRSPSSSGSSLPLAKLKEVLKTASKPMLKQLLEKWPAILEEVKQKQIMVHAWLRDGEPVASGPSFFLLAFKSSIHRETTEKESHRQLIEQVVQQYLQTEAQMVTIMYNEWEDLKQQFIAEHKEKKAEGREEEKQDPFYREAVRLVGEELVEVVDGHPGKNE
ncbi:DNA polymerase-3 subunit gamma/tau [Caldalkalibacillus uzonensis]|uniref:DNA-directed DNA polymerase n=1 Tax=Caldalkalibacillus uzonensis TaxID=353224 RepID=A0ABU0CX93_9BACI|nr:DNA polymerase III subunit gamma/tau [Caldalkalibacillus uzonensis]MDQ0340609.1 DNA polymerase-3 subunit gamma/tau [Caldalkalibacillus uzonensis]